MATEAAAEVTVKRTAHGQGQESVQEGQQSQEDKGVSTAGGWFSWVKSQSEALAQDLAAGVTAESDRLSRNLKGLLDLATQDDESDDEGEERDLTSLQSTTQDAQPNRQPEAEEEADDDVSSGFEEGTLLYKLDTLAEQAESYIGNLSLGLSEQVTTFLKKAVVIVPPIEGQEPRRELRQVPVDRTAALVAVMRASQATYMTDYGSDSVTQQVQDRYKAFESTFEVEKVKDQVVAALREASELVDLHASLVPAQLSYNTFWTRYFFRLSEIQLEEETRKQVLQKAMHNEDDFKWDSDEDEPETLNVVKKEEDVPETIHVMKKKEDGPEKVPEVAATETSQEITPVKDEDPQREAPVEQATPALPQEDSQSNPDPVETSAPPSLDAFDIVSKESADPELLPSTEEAVEPATKEGQPSSEETQKEDVKDNDWDSWE